jgi:hypothetical protein
MAFPYTLMTHDRSGNKRSHPYTSPDPLEKGSVVLLGGRHWLVEGVDGTRVQTRPARYRLSLRHPDGHLEAGAFRRFRSDAPIVGHRLATLENSKPVSWVVMQARLARDDVGEPFIDLIAEQDHGVVESPPDHQLEHAHERQGDADIAVAATLTEAHRAGLAVELVGIEAGHAPDWDEASRYLDSLVLEELEDDLIEQSGVNTRRDPQELWLEIVKHRLRSDLESFRHDAEGRHREIKEWYFAESRIFAAVGNFDDDLNPSRGYGWLCRLVDAGVLQAAGFYRAHKPLLQA